MTAKAVDSDRPCKSKRDFGNTNETRSYVLDATGRINVTCLSQYLLKQKQCFILTQWIISQHRVLNFAVK